MNYDKETLAIRMAILDQAYRLQKDNGSNINRVNKVIETAKLLEAFVFSTPTNETTDDEATKRKAFLASLPQTGCGCGREDCDGSEGTCTCQ